MEGSLTKAARVARKLSAGPRPKKSEVLSAMGALARFLQEMERLANALEGEGLSMEDAQIALMYAAPSSPEFPVPSAGTVLLGEATGDFFDKVMQFPDGTRFLGVLGVIRDREASGKFWPYVKAFLADDVSLRIMLGIVGEARSGKQWKQ